jgi:ubiquinone/menaquinone biosynthesis C-methylase UbiE
MAVCALQDYSLIAERLGVTSNNLLVNQLIEKLEIGRHSLVVDIGCGTAGDAASIARKTGAHVVGLDKSNAMLSRADRIVTPILADTRAIPLRSGCASAAYSVNLMQLLPDRSAMFVEVARILRPKGLFALPTTTHQQLRRRFLNQFFPSLFRIERKRYPKIASLLGELEASGFSFAQCHALHLGTFRIDERYLDRQRTGIISGLGLLPGTERDEGLRRLEHFVAFSQSKKHPRRVRWVRTLVIAQKGKV